MIKRAILILLATVFPHLAFAVPSTRDYTDNFVVGWYDDHAGLFIISGIACIAVGWLIVQKMDYKNSPHYTALFILTKILIWGGIILLIPLLGQAYLLAIPIIILGPLYIIIKEKKNKNK